MVFKVEVCLWVVIGGVFSVYIIDGWVIYCVLVELFIDVGIGIKVVCG